jgi:hypothetical protein
MSCRSVCPRKSSCAVAEAPKRRKTTAAGDRRRGQVQGLADEARRDRRIQAADRETGDRPRRGGQEDAPRLRWDPGQLQAHGGRVAASAIADEQQGGTGDDQRDRIDEEGCEQGPGGESGEESGHQDAQSQPAHVRGRRQGPGQPFASGRGVLEHGDGGRGSEDSRRQSGQNAPDEQQADVRPDEEQHRRGDREDHAGSEHRPAAQSVGEAAEEHERGDDAEGVDREELGGEGGAEAESVLVEGVERCGQGRAHHHDGEYVRRGGQAPSRGGAWLPPVGRLFGHCLCAPLPALRVRRGGCARRAVSDCTLEPGYP